MLRYFEFQNLRDKFHIKIKQSEIKKRKEKGPGF